MIRYSPAAPLDAAVDCIWLSQRREHSQHWEHMLPSGKAQLVITLHDSPIQWAAPGSRIEWHSWTRGLIHGPQTHYYRVGPKPPGIVVGASFRVGMAAAILGVSLDELRDRHVSIEDLWGYRGLELHDRLSSIREPMEICRALEAELIARIRRPLLIHPAVAYALRPESFSAPRVAEIQRRTGYSPRHFIQLFQSAVGLTPKHFYRVQRFSSTLARLARGRCDGGARLADVASASGYADQAHFSREFRELSGVAPSQYCPPAANSEHHHTVTPPGKKASRLVRRQR